MRPCLVGIGGTGGNVLKQFLENQDASLALYSFGEHQAYGDVKGVWLDSANQDVQNQDFYKNLVQGKYPGYFIYHDLIHPDSSTKNYVEKTYGYDLKAQGYDRRAEYLKGVFEIFNFDYELKKIASEEFGGEENPLPSYIWRRGIRPFTTLSEVKSNGKRSTSSESISLVNGFIQINRRKNDHHSKLCDSILFIASLGGGTGTGFINPITSYVRSEELAFPIFAMGILTEKGPDARHATEGQRDLGAIIAMYDLLTKPAGTGIDGLILIDNQILLERFNGNYPAMDSAIYAAMRPLLDLRNYPGAQMQDDAPAIRRVFWESEINDPEKLNKNDVLSPSMFVPCYHSQKGSESSEESMVKQALGEKGRLFPCDPTKTERAYVFTRGFFQTEALIDAIQNTTGITANKIKIYRKLGDNKLDILILLRNPYGGALGDHRHNGTFENRIYEIIVESIKYIEDNQTNIIEYLGYNDLTKSRLRNYFYGDQGLKDELMKALGQLKEGKKPIFMKPLRIFGDDIKAPNESIACESDIKALGLDQANIEELVKMELKKLLASEDCRSKLRELMRS